MKMLKPKRTTRRQLINHVKYRWLYIYEAKLKREAVEFLKRYSQPENLKFVTNDSIELTITDWGMNSIQIIKRPIQ